MPRPNLYQSLHTSVIGPGGMTFEVQIRTEEMHRIAEEGIAAHWKYKEGSKAPDQDDQRIAWLRQLVEWQRDMSDSGEFLSTLKVDLYSGGSLHVHAAWPGDCPTARRHAGRFRLRHPQRHWHVLRRGACERRHEAAQNHVAQRRRRRNPHSPGHQPSRDWLAVVKTPKRATKSATSSTPSSGRKPSKSVRNRSKKKPDVWA